MNSDSTVRGLTGDAYSGIRLSDDTPTREGWEFTVWCADPGLTETITSVRLTKNTTVYAG